MTNPSPLQPPAPTASPPLEAPGPVPAVLDTRDPGLAPRVDDAALPGLDAKVAAYVAAIEATQPGSPQFASRADDVRAMGDTDLRVAAETSNRLLQLPARELREGGVSGASQVSRSLLELRRTVEELDPADASVGKKLLGLIPFGDTLTDYFRKYESAQSHLDAIVRALYDGQDVLRKDNAALNLEKRRLWDTMSRLQEYVYVASRLDGQLSAAIARAELADPRRAVALREDVLFYVRQKHQDLLTQLAVSMQGVMAIDILVRNNLELVKGVDRATTVTVSALRTAVLVAQALNGQRLVLDQITALNTTTASVVASTLARAQTDGAQLGPGGLPELQEAFSDLYGALDELDAFKASALDSVATTLGVLEAETTKARAYLAQTAGDDRRQGSGGSLDLGSV